MKKRLSLIAILVVAFTVLFANFARGQNPQGYVNGLPTSLPIGSTNAMLLSAVNNPHTRVFIRLNFYEPGNPAAYGINDFPGISFSSYQLFQTFIRTNAWSKRNNIAGWSALDGPSPQAQAYLYVDISFSQPPPGPIYDDPATERLTLRMSKNLGLFWNFTTNDLVGIEPYYLRGVSWITNLQRFSIEVKTPTNLYQNQWDVSSQTWTNTSKQYPAEEIVKNAVFFNDWYSTGTNRARFDATVGTVAQRYTQDGPELMPSRLQIRGNRVTVFMSQGSDTIIESSTDQRNWSDEMISLWSSHTNNASLTITNVVPWKFYRGKSK